MVFVDVAIHIRYFVCNIGQPSTMSRKKVGSNTVTYGFWIDAPVTITS
jgi:hypothetical protein